MPKGEVSVKFSMYCIGYDADKFSFLVVCHNHIQSNALEYSTEAFS
jgi:hypothetical protein